eukprot:643146_1
MWQETFPNCEHTALVILPMRDDKGKTLRRDMLRVVIPTLRALFTRREQSYRFVVVEHQHGVPFNKGVSLNVGFDYGTKQWPEVDYVITHDVDLLPHSDNAPYGFPAQPTELCYSNSKENYKKWYNGYFGGVTALQTKEFVRELYASCAGKSQVAPPSYR